MSTTSEPACTNLLSILLLPSFLSKFAVYLVRQDYSDALDWLSLKAEGDVKFKSLLSTLSILVCRLFQVAV
jgi:hypothetical protein